MVSISKYLPCSNARKGEEKLKKNKTRRIQAKVLVHPSIYSSVCLCVSRAAPPGKQWWCLILTILEHLYLLGLTSPHLSKRHCPQTLLLYLSVFPYHILPSPGVPFHPTRHQIVFLNALGTVNVDQGDFLSRQQNYAQFQRWGLERGLLAGPSCHHWA